MKPKHRSSKGKVSHKSAWTEATVLDAALKLSEEERDRVARRLIESLRGHSFERSPRVSVDDLLGCMKYEGPRRSLADMEAAIRIGAKSQR